MKCKQCSKKVSLGAAITCKCGNVYCSEHRFEENHNCTFDFKASEKKHLEKVLMDGKSNSKQIESI